MLTIGLFAQVGQVTVQTLRHYDRLGLLTPSHIDRFTNYRYYALDQLPRLYRILALKELGLSLEQIGIILAKDISAEQIRGMLKLRQSQLTETVQQAQEQMARVEAYIQHIETEGEMPEGDIILKTVEPVLVAGKRILIPKHSGGLLPELNEAFMDAAGYVDKHNAFSHMPGIAVWFTPPDQQVDVDIEATIPINQSLTGTDQIAVHELPRERMASLMYQGDFDQYLDSYRVILGWLDRNGYTITGPFREVYHKFDWNALNDITVEIQFPVTKE